MVSRPAEQRRRPQKTRAARDHMPQSSAFDGPQGASHVEIMSECAPAGDKPNLDEVGQALDRIVRDGARAGSVVHRIRDLVKKSPARGEPLGINDAIREVIELTRSEATKNGVMVRTQLAEDLPVVRGDRVELQQVILNLVLNALAERLEAPVPSGPYARAPPWRAA